MSLQPSRWLVTCLRVLMSRDAANAAVGDALEELAERTAAGRAPQRPRAWLNRRLAGAVAAGLGNSVPRGLRTGGLILRDAGRSLRAAPWHSAFVVGILAVAMTLASVTFAVVDAVMLKPLPYPDADRLVSVSSVDAERKVRITPDVFRDLRARLQTAESLAARTQTTSGAPLTIGGQTFVRTVTYSERLALTQLGLQPSLGRLWTTEEEDQDHAVAVLGYRFWKDRLGGSPDVLGSVVSVGEESGSYRIIGVLAAESDHPYLRASNADVWVPARLHRARSQFGIGIIARLRTGATPVDLATEIQSITGTPDWRPTVTPLLETYLQPETTRWTFLALVASLLVVLVACVNVANLMLTRAGVRSQELAVRASLGASRGRLAATLMAEGMILSLSAGVVGLAAALGGAQVARSMLMSLPYGIFRADSIVVDMRVVAVTAFGALAVGVFVAVLAAWSVTRTPVSGVLKVGEGTTHTGRARWGRFLLSGEVAAVAILAVISSMFIGSLVRMLAVDLGVETSQLVAVKPRLGFRGPISEVRERLERVPGVVGVSMSRGASLPLVGHAYGGAWAQVQVRPVGAGSGGDPVAVHQYVVTPNYFEVAGLRFLRGSGWTAEAVNDSPSVVLDERAARLIFGASDPLGQTIRPEKAQRDYLVVGIVPFVPVRGPEADVAPSAYFSYSFNQTATYAEFFVRTNEPVEVAMPRIAEALGPIGPPGDEAYVFAAGEALRRLTAMRRFTAGLMSVFGLVGLLIGAAGVYAVMASVVSQQTRDIGIRMALGASAQRIANGVFTMAGWHVCIGLAIGVPAAWWLSRGFASLLFGVTPTDISVYATVGAVLMVTAFAAAWLPARRAARVDPIVSLRN
ncbi:MAG: hypothetical protein AMXMBFR57_31250 [Acidimicrobiia bacterium]